MLSKLDVKINHASKLYSNGDYNGALKILEEISKIQANNTKVLELFGLIYFDLEMYEISKFYLISASKHSKLSINAQFCLGNLYLLENLLKDSIYCFKEIINDYGDIFEVLHELGRAYGLIGDIDQALFFFNKCLNINKSDSVYFNIACCYDELCSYTEAISNYKLCIELNPNFSSAFYNLGLIYYKLREYKNALINFNHSVKIDPSNLHALNNIGIVLHDLGRYEMAIEKFNSVFNKNPNFDYVIGNLINTKLHICDWSDINNLKNVCKKMVLNFSRAVQPLSLLALFDDPKLHKIAAEIYNKDKFPLINSYKNIDLKKGKTIRIGYFSSDFYNHATSFLIADILEKHNRKKFSIYGFSFGPNKNDQMRNRIISSFDKFYDVDNLKDQDIVKIARELNLDIAIDLKGYTANCRTSIFANGCAPIQISYLGYPGTMSANYINYIIADNTVIPEEEHENYSEKIVYLPNCYQCNDPKKLVSKRNFSRRDFGIPKDSFVFCCFNHSYKILPEMFDIWMEILKSVNDSVLWLLGDNLHIESNLRYEAGKRGVDANRLIFAGRLPLDEHLSRHSCADLFLDTFPYNAHTTASDALWAGLPLLTIKGRSFASRVGASLLNTIGGCDFLICDSSSDYKDRAIFLAKNKHYLIKFKEKIATRISLTLFNSQNFVENLEKCYENIYCNHINF